MPPRTDEELDALLEEVLEDLENPRSLPFDDSFSEKELDDILAGVSPVPVEPGFVLYPVRRDPIPLVRSRSTPTPLRDPPSFERLIAEVADSVTPPFERLLSEIAQIPGYAVPIVAAQTIQVGSVWVLKEHRVGARTVTVTRCGSSDISVSSSQGRFRINRRVFLNRFLPHPVLWQYWDDPSLPAPAALLRTGQSPLWYPSLA